MSTPYIGEVRAVSFAGIPKGWAACNGQLLSIAQNQALFAILGTTYGGDGMTTFALPNLQGRTPIGSGNGVALGEPLGTPEVTLIPVEMPSHAHTLVASAAAGAEDPTNRAPAAAKAYGPFTPTVPLAPTLAPAGGSQPHNNMQPYLTLNYIIALEGIFPSRS